MLRTRNNSLWRLEDRRQDRAQEKKNRQPVQAKSVLVQRALHEVWWKQRVQELPVEQMEWYGSKGSDMR